MAGAPPRWGPWSRPLGCLLRGSRASARGQAAYGLSRDLPGSGASVSRGRCLLTSVLPSSAPPLLSALTALSIPLCWLACLRAAERVDAGFRPFHPRICQAAALPGPASAVGCRARFVPGPLGSTCSQRWLRGDGSQGRRGAALCSFLREGGNVPGSPGCGGQGLRCGFSLRLHQPLPPQWHLAVTVRGVLPDQGSGQWSCCSVAALPPGALPLGGWQCVFGRVGASGRGLGLH